MPKSGLPNPITSSAVRREKSTWPPQVWITNFLLGLTSFVRFGFGFLFFIRSFQIRQRLESYWHLLSFLLSVGFSFLRHFYGVYDVSGKFGLAYTPSTQTWFGLNMLLEILTFEKNMNVQYPMCTLLWMYVVCSVATLIFYFQQFTPDSQ